MKKIIIIIVVSMMITSSVQAESKAALVQSYLKGYAELGKAAAAMVSAQASIITARANARATNAKTLEILQTVRSMGLDNDLKQTKIFFDKRKLNKDYKMQYPSKRPSQETLLRYSQASTPERLNNYELSSLRGIIYWPEIFQRDEFLEYRIELDSLFVRRKVKQDGLERSLCYEAKLIINRMYKQLQDIMREMSPAEYIEARKFIESLSYEAQLPPDIKGMAIK